jgi:hypothetical protein
MTSVKLFKTPKTETVLNNELFLKAIAKGLTGKQLRVIICIDALRGAGDVVFPAEIQGYNIDVTSDEDWSYNAVCAMCRTLRNRGWLYRVRDGRYVGWQLSRRAIELLKGV